MKKSMRGLHLSVVCIFMAAVMAVMLGGCTEGTGGIASGDTAGTTAGTTVNSEPILYKNEKNEFSIMFPASWRDLYGIVEYDNGVSVYHKATDKELNTEGEEGQGGYGSLIFLGKKLGEYTQDDPPVKAGRCQILLVKDGFTYYGSFPSDVQYNEDPNSETAKEYNKMSAELDSIMETFTVL